MRFYLFLTGLEEMQSFLSKHLGSLSIIGKNGKRTCVKNQVLKIITFPQGISNIKVLYFEIHFL